MLFSNGIENDEVAPHVDRSRISLYPSRPINVYLYHSCLSITDPFDLLFACCCTSPRMQAVEEWDVGVCLSLIAELTIEVDIDGD